MPAAAIAPPPAATGDGWQSDRRPVVAVRGFPADLESVPLDEAPGAVWERSVIANRSLLRFGPQVQGAVCLRPTWGDLLVGDAGAHLRPAPGTAAEARLGSPGSLPQSRISALLPLAVLAGGTPAATGGNGRLLMIGLGAGIGAVVLAHHFPRLRIEAVELDPSVAGAARLLHPLLDWLATPAPAGAGRIGITVADAIDHVAYAAGAGARYDAIVLDAFGADGAVPEPLLAPAFLADLARLLAPDGALLANLIAPPSSPIVPLMARRLAGCGLTTVDHLAVPPALAMADAGPAPDDATRNHLLLASALPRTAAALERCRTFRPFADLAAGTCVTREVALARRVGDLLLFRSTCVAPPAGWEERIDRWWASHPPILDGGYRALADPPAAAALRTAVLAQTALPPAGWSAGDGLDGIIYRVVDWAEHARHAWQATITGWPR